MAIALTARLSRLWSTTVMSSAASGASPDDGEGEAAIGLTCVAVKVMHSFDCAGTDGRPTRFAGKREVVCSASGQAFKHLLREWR
ncbi:hypothetical protein VI03_27215 [Burkholderia vietnamiensis]|nr:hypothetical protein VI03_27215 [Burkholderia vietnamiensis]